jgi:imidazole glycerol-phosphate synthase subunit HisF
MLKKRLIFSLLYNDGFFCLSRNFRLQKIGDYNWLINNYGFLNIYNAIDELIILDVSRHDKKQEKFFKIIELITSNFYIPISIGGGISNIQHAENYFKLGADKIIINSNLKNIKLVNELSLKYGAQAIIGSVDFSSIKENNFFINNGEKKVNSFDNYKEYIMDLEIGELLFNSIDYDGTGQGLDIEFYKKYCRNFNKPLLISGGVGKTEHILEGLNLDYVSGVVTANLLNFVKDGLINARKNIQTNFKNVVKR